MGASGVMPSSLRIEDGGLFSLSWLWVLRLRLLGCAAAVRVRPSRRRMDNG